MASARRANSDIEDERVLAILTKSLPPIIAKSVLDRARREAVWNPEGTWADPNGLLDRLSIGVRLFAAPPQQAEILRALTDLAAAVVVEGTGRRPGDDAPITLRTADDAGPTSGHAASVPRSDSPRSDVPTVRRPPDLSATPRAADALPASRGIFRTHVSRTPAPAPAQRLPAAAPRGAKPESPAQATEVIIALAAEHDISRARQIAREVCESLKARALTQQRVVTIVSELARNIVSYAGSGQITLRVPAGERRIVILAVDQGPGIPQLQEILAGRYKSRSGLGLGIIGTRRLSDAFEIESGRGGTSVRVEVVVT